MVKKYFKGGFEEGQTDAEDFSDDEAEDLPLTQNQLNNLFGLHFDDGELQMAFEINPNLTYQQIVDRYYQTALEDFNLNLPEINTVIQAEELSNILDTTVEKRDVASQAINFILDQNGGGKRRKTNKKSRKNKTNKKSSNKKSINKKSRKNKTNKKSRKNKTNKKSRKNKTNKK